MIITAPRVIPALPGSGVLEPGFVRIAGGRIAEVGAGAPPGRPDLALASGVLAPGLVDLQVNGYFGVELDGARTRTGGRRVAARPARAPGRTAFLPTFITAPVDRLAGALRSAAGVRRAAAGQRRAGARRAPGGAVHRARSGGGAHNPEWITDPSPAAVG